LHAIADADNSRWFFDFIQKTGLNAELHSFAENHRFIQQDIHFPEADAILMPEENALQCHDFANDTLWALPKEAWINSELQAILLKKLGNKPSSDIS
jgi:tetraacyldisaccharide 4'-kinase